MTIKGHKNITRPDKYGYQVRIVRGGKTTSKYFSFKSFDGEEGALAAALAWRNEQEQQLPKLYINESPKNNSSGVNGVSRIIHWDYRQKTISLRYQVSFRANKSKPSIRTFHVGKLAEITAFEELHAFRTAVHFRKEYERTRLLNIDFDTGRYRNWRKQKLY